MDGNSDSPKRTAHTTRRRLLAATGAVGLGLLAGCASGGGGEGSGGGSDEDESTDGTPESDGTDGNGESMDDGSAGTSWRTTELTDVRSGETFTVDSFERPVVLESFAVWCPKCDRQQRQLAELDDSVAVVSLNTDPNEDAEKVREHAEENGFDWRYAVAPAEMTQSLVDEFGTAVTNAPSTPVIVACQDGTATFMSGTINTPEEIMNAAGEC